MSKAKPKPPKSAPRAPSRAPLLALAIAAIAIAAYYGLQSGDVPEQAPGIIVDIDCLPDDYGGEGAVPCRPTRCGRLVLDDFIDGTNPTKSVPSTLHWLIPAKQYSPLAQSVLSPHAHLPASVFGDNPSVSVHFGTGYARHKLLTALQKKPAPDAQSMDPQRHTPGFSVVPDSSAQGGA